MLFAITFTISQQTETHIYEKINTLIYMLSHFTSWVKFDHTLCYVAYMLEISSITYIEL